MKFQFARLLFLLILAQDTVSIESNKFVIGAHAGGFFSSFFSVLNCLDYADRYNKIPVVDFNFGLCFYKQAKGYHGFMNPWEYYFEPVSNLKYVDGDPVHIGYAAPDGTYIAFSSFKEYEKNYRIKWNAVINKHIKIKSYILDKINFFYEHYLQGKITVGIHLRGTDKYKEISQVAPELILARANSLASELGSEVQFLVATDEEKLLDLAKTQLKGKVVYYDVSRSIDDRPLFLNTTLTNRALFGEEVLIEAILLSRCNVVVHTFSNVSTAVGFFNPYLKLELLMVKP